MFAVNPYLLYPIHGLPQCREYNKSKFAQLTCAAEYIDITIQVGIYF